MESNIRKFLDGFRYHMIIISKHISIRVKKLHHSFPVLSFMLYYNYKLKMFLNVLLHSICYKIYAPKISYYHISFALTKRVFISRIYAVFGLKWLICMYSNPDKFSLLYQIFASCSTFEFSILSSLLHININIDAVTFLKLSDVFLRSSSSP